MRTDYHVHMHESGDFSIDWLKKYVHKAKEEGVEDFGISEHAYFFHETKSILSNPWVDGRRGLAMDDYLQMFEHARDEGIQVKMGIEMDYTPGKEREMADFISNYPFDYVIGSIHWIGNWGIDLIQYRDEYENRNIYDVYEAYFDQVVTLAQSGLFDIIGHLDLVKIFNYRPQDHAFLEEQYERAAQALAQSETSIEISTAGLRKPVGEIYPAPTLLQKCYDAGVTIVLSSDAHQPAHVGYAYEQAIQFARSVGYTEVQVLSHRVKEAFPLG